MSSASESRSQLMQRIFEHTDQALTQMQLWRDQSLTIGFTNGCFDILHRGHAAYLAKAKESCDRLVLGLNSDQSIKSIKGADRPIINQSDRAYLVSQLRSVDMVIIFDETTATRLLEQIKPDIYIKGGDYNPDQLPEAPAVRSYGGTIKIIPFIDGYSTTGLIHKIQKL